MYARILIAVVALATVSGCAASAQFSQMQTQLKRLQSKVETQERVFAHDCERRVSPQKGKHWVFAPPSRGKPRQCSLLHIQSRRPMDCDFATCKAHDKELKRWRLRQACIIGKCKFPKEKQRGRYGIIWQRTIIPRAVPRERLMPRPRAVPRAKSCPSGKCTIRLPGPRRRSHTAGPRPPYPNPPFNE